MTYYGMMRGTQIYEEPPQTLIIQKQPDPVNSKNYYYCPRQTLRW
jgi:hypothetical protein